MHEDRGTMLQECRHKNELELPWLHLLIKERDDRNRTSERLYLSKGS